MFGRDVVAFCHLSEADTWALYLMRQGTLDPASDESKNLLAYFSRITGHRDRSAARIMMYRNIAARKKNAAFTSVDMGYMDEHALKLNGEENSQYFIEQGVEQLGRRFAKLFEQGRRWVYLLNNQYRREMADLIVGWARAGLLNHKDDKLGKELTDMIGKLDEDTGNVALQDKVKSAASDTNMVSNFFAYYVDDRSWEPWFQVVSSYDSKHTLIGSACLHHGINIQVYERKPDALNEIVPTHEIKSSNNVDGGATLHILYDVEQNRLSTLDPVTSPSHLYNMLAVRESYQLLKQKPYDPVALQVIGLYGGTDLLIRAQEAMKEKNLNAPKIFSMTNALGLFADAHKGSCEDDKFHAQNLRAGIEGRKRHGMFSPEGAITAATLALSGALLYLTQRK